MKILACRKRFQLRFLIKMLSLSASWLQHHAYILSSLWYSRVQKEMFTHATFLMTSKFKIFCLLCRKLCQSTWTLSLWWASMPFLNWNPDMMIKLLLTKDWCRVIMMETKIIHSKWKIKICKNSWVWTVNKISKTSFIMIWNISISYFKKKVN